MAKTQEVQNIRIGFKVHKYRNSFENPNWTPLLTNFGKSNTDKSTYRPDISVARAQAGMSNKTLLYDFSDGKDTGETVQTYIRQKGLDVTEVDAAMQRLNNNFNENVKEELSKQEADKQKKKLNDVMDKALSEKQQDSSNSEQDSAK